MHALRWFYTQENITQTQRQRQPDTMEAQMEKLQALYEQGIRIRDEKREVNGILGWAREFINVLTLYAEMRDAIGELLALHNQAKTNTS